MKPETFKMNEEVDSLLPEKVSNLLLTRKVNSFTVDNPTKFYLSMINSPLELQNGISILNEHTGFESVETLHFFIADIIL